MARIRITRRVAATVAAAGLLIAVGVNVATADLAGCSNCIEAGDIATGAVHSDEIYNGTVTSSDLASSAKSTVKDFTDTDVLISGTTLLGSMSVPAGTWWVVGTFSLDNDTEGEDVFVSCKLKAGSTIVDDRELHVAIGDGGIPDALPVAMQDVNAFDGSTSVSMNCTPASTPSALHARYVKLTISRVLNRL